MDIEQRLARANHLLAQRREQNREHNRPKIGQFPASSHLAALTTRLATNETNPPAEPIPPQPTQFDSAEVVPIYTSLATAITRNKATAAGRVWAVLHHVFNRSGRQVVPVGEVIELLCSAESPYRLFTARQWRNIKPLGDGIFWQTAGRGAGLLIHGARHVACALDVARLEVGRVNVPLKLLLKSVKSAKSAFYATLDASRPNRPISRATKAQLTGIDAVSQWRLEKGGGLISAETNYQLITPLADRETVENEAWTYRASTFAFIDVQGKQGKAKQTYLARQLPNTYKTKLHKAANGRRRKINRRLNDHVTKGARGERSKSDFQRCYFESGRELAKSKEPAHSKVVRVVCGSSRLWFASQA